MKHLSLSILLLLAITVFNCKDQSVSSAECTPVVQSMLGNFGDMNPNATDEEKEKAKVMLTPVLQKECESGKYKLECLKSAKSIAELQNCKN
ncbi:MAG: TIGR04454 family lipoprotein [Leptospiraceae bacterium]|nr:TIGR04454 family lipoprotein [Leptospiraceae bacterium]